MVLVSVLNECKYLSNYISEQDTAKVMADLFVALPPVTLHGAVIFGKNSNRPASEVQDVINFPAKDHPEGEKLKVSNLFNYILITFSEMYILFLIR